MVVSDHVLQAMLEEFGKWIKPGTRADQAERDQFYSAIYQQVLDVSALSDRALGILQRGNI